jgi:hypothetical protein
MYFPPSKAPPNLCVSKSGPSGTPAASEAPTCGRISIGISRESRQEVFKGTRSAAGDRLSYSVFCDAYHCSHLTCCLRFLNPTGALSIRGRATEAVGRRRSDFLRTERPHRRSALILGLKAKGK